MTETTWTVWDWMLRTRPVSEGSARERIGGRAIADLFDSRLHNLLNPKISQKKTRANERNPIVAQKTNPEKGEALPKSASEEEIPARRRRRRRRRGREAQPEVKLASIHRQLLHFFLCSTRLPICHCWRTMWVSFYRQLSPKKLLFSFFTIN